MNNELIFTTNKLHQSYSELTIEMDQYLKKTYKNIDFKKTYLFDEKFKSPEPNTESFS